jgi:transposase InsO family protein
MYCGGTIFVDIASGTVHVYHQVSPAVADILLSKAQFEHEARTHGIDVKKYHTDNGIFMSAAWKEHLHGLQQTQRLSATGAHHQNVIVERAIQTVTTSTRAMLLHLTILNFGHSHFSMRPCCTTIHPR